MHRIWFVHPVTNELTSMDIPSNDFAIFDGAIVFSVHGKRTFAFRDWLYVEKVS
jgi:hypothetical protein